MAPVLLTFSKLQSLWSGGTRNNENQRNLTRVNGQCETIGGAGSSIISFNDVKQYAHNSYPDDYFCSQNDQVPSPNFRRLSKNPQRLWARRRFVLKGRRDEELPSPSSDPLNNGSSHDLLNHETVLHGRFSHHGTLDHINFYRETLRIPTGICTSSSYLSHQTIHRDQTIRRDPNISINNHSTWRRWDANTTTASPQIELIKSEQHLFRNGDLLDGRKQIDVLFQQTSQPPIHRMELVSLERLRSSSDAIALCDGKVHSSIRLGHSSIDELWQEIYQRETALVVCPKFKHLLWDDDLSFAAVGTDHKKEGTEQFEIPGTPVGVSNNTLIGTSFRYPETTVTPASREPVVRWMDQVVRNMKWKRSTFYVAVHAMDSYIFHFCDHEVREGVITERQTEAIPNRMDSSEIGSCHYTKSNIEKPPQRRLIGGAQSSQSVETFFPAPSKQVRWRRQQLIEGEFPVLSTAALFLGVATEEEHSQAHRAKLFVREVPCVDSIQQIFIKQLDIVTALANGLLITKTPEDFLYYYLANLKVSTTSKYSTAYQSLLGLNKDQTISRGDSRKNLLMDIPISVPEIRLDILIELTLAAVTLVFEKGGYVYLPASRLIAACLVPILAITALPELGHDKKTLDQFAIEILKLNRPETLLVALTFVLPMLSEYLKCSLNDNDSGEGRSILIRKDLLMIYSAFEFNLNHQIVAPISSMLTPPHEKSSDTSTTDSSGGSSLGRSSGSSMSTLDEGPFTERGIRVHTLTDDANIQSLEDHLNRCRSTTCSNTRLTNRGQRCTNESFKCRRHAVQSNVSPMKFHSKIYSRRQRSSAHQQRAQRLHELINRLDHHRAEIENSLLSGNAFHPLFADPSAHPPLESRIQ